MKKRFVIISICAALLCVGGIVYFLNRQQSAKVVSPEATPTPSHVSISDEMLSWSDPAGFIFMYPKGIDIDKHDEDVENYAHLELTHAKNPGTITIWAKDTTAQDAAGWVKSNKSFMGATVFETTMGDIIGKKIILTNPKRLTVAAVVDEGIVFYVEGDYGESEYWQKAFETIASSFKFSATTEKSSDPDQSGSQEAIDEEEVIE